VSRKAAKGSVYAFTNHCRSVTEAPRSARITGSAVVTTRLSSVTMKTGMPTAASTAASGRWCAAAGAGRSEASVLI
jgi:hypothetical protein